MQLALFIVSIMFTSTLSYFDVSLGVNVTVGNNFHAAVRLGSVWFGLGAIDCLGRTRFSYSLQS